MWETCLFGGRIPRRENTMAKKEKAKKADETIKEIKPQEEKVTGTAETKPDNAKEEPKKPKTKKVVSKEKKIISKRFTAIKTLVDVNKSYGVEEAIELAKKTATTKFDGSIETHIRLGIDVKKGDQQVRGGVSLPHGTGKTKKIAAFVAEGKEDEAKSAGADMAGSIELINKIKQTGKIDFEVAVATPDMMPKLAGIAKILGPKGLMPSPKNETITTNLKKTIEELKKGKINFKNDDTGNVHVTIGKASFETKKLTENFQTLFSAIKRTKPASSKGIYIKNVSINATMGPGIKISVN